MDRARSSTKAGFTLIEVTMVITLIGLISGSVLAVLRTTTRSCQVASTSARLEAQANETLDRIASRLRASALSTINPVLSAPFSSRQIDFQPSVGTAGGVTVWGPTERIEFQYRPRELNDGKDNDRDGFVDDGRVVWTSNVGLPTQRSTVWADYVSEYLQGESPNGVDDNGNGIVDESGLCFTVDGTSILARLTLQARDSSGVLLRRTVSARIFFRNH